MGVPEERILDGTPRDLEPYNKAYKIRRKVEDENMWLNNIYTLNAVSAAIGPMVLGKKAKAKYPNAPLLQEQLNNKHEENSFTDAERFEMWAIAYNANNQRGREA